MASKTWSTSGCWKLLPQGIMSFPNTETRCNIIGMLMFSILLVLSISPLKFWRHDKMTEILWATFYPLFLNEIVSIWNRHFTEVLNQMRPKISPYISATSHGRAAFVYYVKLWVIWLKIILNSGYAATHLTTFNQQIVTPSLRIIFHTLVRYFSIMCRGRAAKWWQQ